MEAGTAAASGAGQPGVGRLVQTPCLVRWRGQGQWFGDPAGSSAYLTLGNELVDRAGDSVKR